MNKFLAIVAAAAVLGSTAPAFAAGTIMITNNNDAVISNDIHTKANTGRNVAAGSSAILQVAEGNMSDSGGANEAGNGGNTVTGGAGGVVQTGNASATTNVLNKVNITKTNINATDWAVDDVAIATNNVADLLNTIRTRAYTGDNRAEGSAAAVTVAGGSLSAAGGSTTIGNGGNVVDGGENGGGAVITGNSTSNSSVMNVINRVIARIKK